MSASKSELSLFIKSTKTAIGNARNFPHKVILGNEAGDADSMISSLCLSYLSSKSSSLKQVFPVNSFIREDSGKKKK